MNPDDPNLQRVELVARALGELCEELVFVGGSAAGLLCTSVQAPPSRATFDVDLIGEVAVDLMPTDERVLGFSNRWYPAAIAGAKVVVLPSGARIRLISAPAFLATKFEAFATRGANDQMASHDFEDIINVLDGRPAVVAEIAEAGRELGDYLALRFREVVSHPDFENILPGLVVYDELYDRRIEAVRERARTIAGLSGAAQ